MFYVQAQYAIRTHGIFEYRMKGGQKADPTEARDFAVLVLDQDRRVVGRLTVWDVLQGLEPQARKRVDSLAMVEGYDAWDRPLGQLASKVRNLRARDLVHARTLACARSFDSRSRRMARP